MNKLNKIAFITYSMFASFILIAVLISGCSKEEEKSTEQTVQQQEETVEAPEVETEEQTMNVTVYAYCPCSICNTARWKGMVSTGKRMKAILAEGKNICAADPDIIPLGSTIEYDGVEYYVCDTGSRIKGKTINILLKNHKMVREFGVKKNQTITLIK